MMWWWGGSWMFFGPIIFIFCIVMMFIMMGDGMFHRDDPRSNRALDILKERFARGEIDKAEFEERRRSLGA